jgi:hypothetical protein
MPEKPEDVSSFPLFTPTVQEAVTLVRNADLHTLATDSIQEALNKRLNRLGSFSLFVFFFSFYIFFFQRKVNFCFMPIDTKAY